MVRLCSALVTALAGPAAEEHPPSATASAADARTPRYLSLVLPLRSATLRQNTRFSHSLCWSRSPPGALKGTAFPPRSFLARQSRQRRRLLAREGVRAVPTPPSPPRAG